MKLFLPTTSRGASGQPVPVAIATPLQGRDTVVSSVQADTRGDAKIILEKQPNFPLEASENEAARKLVTLDDQLIHQIEKMSPEASAYARRRWRNLCFIKLLATKGWDKGLA